MFGDYIPAARQLSALPAWQARSPRYGFVKYLETEELPLRTIGVDNVLESMEKDEPSAPQHVVMHFSTEERKTEMAELKKLTEEDLEQVSGGVFVQSKNGWYQLMEDEHGFYLGSTPPDDVDNLQIYANNHHVSSEIITPEEYQARFNKPFICGN